MNWLEEKAIRITLSRFLKGAQMQAILDFFSGKKTYITGLVTIVMSLASLLGVAIPGVPVLDKNTAIQTIITALMGIFIRQGVAKTEKP